MIFQAVVGNPSHPEYGVATIPFPIPNDEYDHSIGLLEDLEVGDAVQTDLEVKEINGTWPVLKCLEDTVVNVDELDYLAKRLESFDFGEAAQFQAMADKLKLKSVPDLINLTFCCQQATVITDFSDLNAVGRDHYMNLRGGCVRTQELEDLDGEETAILLIDGGGGTITRYGVVYDNGMKLEQHYDGRHLPGYFYEQNVLAVVIAPKTDVENTSNLTWIYLPCSKLQIEHALQRSGIADPEDMRFMYENSALPSEVEEVLELRQESIFELNDLAHVVLASQLKDHSMHRVYDAIVVGSFREDSGTVDAPIGRHPSDRKKMCVIARNSKEAVTHWEVVKRYRGYTHIRCRLETGRTHQIRVQMAGISHPVFGDMRYGGANAQKGKLALSLEALAVKKQFTALFNDEEANNALMRLLDAGYKF